MKDFTALMGLVTTFYLSIFLLAKDNLRFWLIALALCVAVTLVVFGNLDYNRLQGANHADG
jgi:Ca2+/Na+ antiporter